MTDREVKQEMREKKERILILKRVGCSIHALLKYTMKIRFKPSEL